jgi:hypothetical protein
MSAMAKKKKREDDEHEKEHVEDSVVADDEEAAVVEEADIAEEAVAEEAVAEEAVAEEAVADEAVIAEPGSPDRPDSPVEVAEEPKPKGRNTTLTLVLCGLNVLAAIGFAYLLVLNFHKRQEWSFGVFLNELSALGLPLKQEDEGVSASRATAPRQKLDSKQITEVFRQRGGKGSGEFWTVDEPFPSRIRPAALTQEVLKDYFKGHGVPALKDEMVTLEDEVKRLQNKVPADIEAAAAEAAEALKAKSDADKRQFIAKVLLPLAYDIYQVAALDAKLQAAKGAELDGLLKESVERRLLMDILAPLEIFRPGDVSKFFLEKAGDLKALPLDQIKERWQKRVANAVAPTFDGDVHQGPDWNAEKRSSWEKRDTIGLLLLAIASAQKPDAAKPGQFVPLYADAGPAGTPNLARAQIILGLFEFAAAAQNLPIAWRTLERRAIEAIHVDREGFSIIFKDKSGQFKDDDGKPARSQAFIDKHEEIIKRIQDLILAIRAAEERLKDLQAQNKNAQMIVEDREKHFKAMTEKLIAARKETARMIGELRVLQKELYQAQVVLRDAEEQNARLVREIRAEERKASGAKGGTP